MKRTLLCILLLALTLFCTTNKAFALTEEEVLRIVENDEAYYVEGSPLTKQDFYVFSTSEDIENYDYDMFVYMNAQGFEFFYPNTDKNISNYISLVGTYDYNPTISYTYRGVSIDDRSTENRTVEQVLYSKEYVLLKYGVGVTGDFDPTTDALYVFFKTFEPIRYGYDFIVDILSNCKTWLFYNYKDAAQIKFYFDANDEICFMCYSNYVEDYYVKWLFKEAQTASEAFKMNVNVWGKIGTWAKADKTLTKRIQTYLNQNGYDCGTPDGIAGEKTEAALTKFQQDHDLFPSGLIDDVLMKYPDSQGWQ